MKKSRKNFPVFWIILIFLSIKIFHIVNQKGISWDSAVYIGMGKFLFSLGKAGLWEPARPLVWPILLGSLWKIGLNPLITGKILELFFSIGCIYITYLIGKNIFNKKIALLASFFLAFSPTFISYSSIILTGIPSTFFALLSVYLLIKKKYFLTGLLMGLSFMTRFLQLFLIIPILIYILLIKKNKIKNIINLTKGLAIITVPYLILNTFLYKNPLHPFLLQSFMTKNTGWIYHQPLQFYFINLLKENFLLLFAIIGTILIIKQKKKEKTLILAIFLLFFIFFNVVAHKELRFIITFLPYMYLITSYGIFKSLNLIKKKKLLIYLTIIFISTMWLLQEIPQINTPSYTEYPEFTNYLEENEIKDGIWISNPIFIADTNKKANELIYYPLYNSKKITLLKNNLNKAKHILIDTCDILPCPKEDKDCAKNTDNFLNTMKKDFKTIYQKKENNCEQFIFSSH